MTDAPSAAEVDPLLGWAMASSLDNPPERPRRELR